MMTRRWMSSWSAMSQDGPTSGGGGSSARTSRGPAEDAGGDATLLSAREADVFARATTSEGGHGDVGEGGVGSFASGGVGGIRDSCGGAGGFRWRPRGAGRGRLVAHPRIDARARGGVRRSLSRAGGRARRRERRASVRRRTCAARRTGARARGASLEAGLGGPPGWQTLASTKLLAQTASPSDESAEALAHAAGAKGPFGGCGSAVVRATRSAPRRAGVTSFPPRFSRRGPHGPGKKQLARDRTLTQE